MTFTVEERNEVTGKASFRGTFPTRDQADTYVDGQARRSRSFTTFQVWSGTPRGPIKPLGPVVRGVALEENPSGGAWVLGIAAVLVGGWLLLRPKKKEETPAPPTTAPPPQTPPPDPIPVIPIIGCAINQAQFESWIAAAKRNGPWLSQTGTPPMWAEIQKTYPHLKNVAPERGAAATDNGTSIWLYSAFGIPFKRADARKNICDWVKDPSTPVLAT